MMHKHHKTKGLRIVLEIIDPYTNEVRWIDATCIHPTCKSRIKSEISDLREGIKSALEARTNNQKNQLEGRKGHAVLKQTQTKHNTYAPQWQKFGTNILSGGVAGSMSLTFVYSLDYA